MLNVFRKFKYIDVPLLVTTLLLIVAGLAVLYSTSVTSQNLGVFYKQAIYAGIGLAAFFFFSFFDYKTLAKTNRIIYPLIVLVLIYLLIFGSVIRGGKRWVELPFFNFQPAEFVKIIVILGLARLLHLKRGQINSWSILIWSLTYALIPAGLVILEPDLGSALVILGLWLGMVLISPIKKKVVFVLFISALILTGVTWKFVLRDFQKDRIKVFINPALDPRGRGYNVQQATIAVGSGKIFGRGFGQGLQSQNRFLPERQTDFIFAASGEEIGFVGLSAIVGLFLFLCARLLKIIPKARDDLGMYIVGGVLFFVLIHTVVNAGMNLGLLPVTGIPLPFFSAGGSNLIVILSALGIAQNVSLESKFLRF